MAANRNVNHEQNQSVCAMRFGGIRDVPSPTSAREDVGFSVQAVRGGRESGQPLLPVRGDVERLAGRRVLSVTAG